MKYTRLLYEGILQRLSWTNLQGKGFLIQYNRLIRTIVSRIKPSSQRVTEEGNIPFEDIMKILRDKRQEKAVNTETDKFVKALDG